MAGGPTLVVAAPPAGGLMMPPGAMGGGIVGRRPSPTNGILVRRDSNVEKPRRKVSFSEDLDKLASAPSLAAWAGRGARSKPIPSAVGSRRYVGLMPDWLSRPEESLRVQGPQAAGPFPRSSTDARALDEAGAFAIVLEGVLEPIAIEATGAVSCPTIGIGASAQCDGQVLVTEDMLGMFERVPRFVKKYADIAGVIETTVAQYAEEVRGRSFPTPDQTYQPKS